MTYRGRFAPSPTGPLHFGSLVAALASWLDARANGGQWLVRIEDVDTTRTVPGAADDILRALEAFGLHWDGEVVRQSDRTGRYRGAIERLRAGGLVYRCKCSRREIADSALQGIEAMIYPGTCRDLALAPEIDGAERLRVPDRRVVFVDRVMGRVTQNVAREIGDFVLRRRDGLFAYQLAVAVDDAEQGITDVVRGSDLLLSTPRQIVLQQALSLATPRYLHVPVATNSQGQKLSKQTRAAPIDPRAPSTALVEALSFLGHPAVEPLDPEALLAHAAASWNPGKVQRHPAKVVTFGHRGDPVGGV